MKFNDTVLYCVQKKVFLFNKAHWWIALCAVAFLLLPCLSTNLNHFENPTKQRFFPSFFPKHSQCMCFSRKKNIIKH